MTIDLERQPEYLSMRDAGRKVKRSRRTIRRWMANGMPYLWFEGRKYVELADLQRTFRGKIATNPITPKQRRESALASIARTQRKDFAESA